MVKKLLLQSSYDRGTGLALVRKPWLVLSAIFVANFLTFSVKGINESRAAPSGGQVAAGLAQITKTGATTTITQSSQRATIDWQSFSVAASETVLFQVPNSESATLNRVIGNGASLIQGTIVSNGILYLINPSGLVFDVGSRVTANRFVASTANITTSDFMANRVDWSRFGEVGTKQIISSGTIKANSISLYGYDLTITDKIDASSKNGKGGSVTLVAKNKLLVASTAEISASGCETAERCAVVLHPTKTNSGGGKIAIGGDFHGAGAIPTAANVTVESGARINASAGLRGQGGEVTVWANQHTEYKGTIEAKGGSLSGNGGTVEVSGKQTLDFQGRVSTVAPHGKTGTLLLDPRNIEIVTTAVAVPDLTVSYMLTGTVETELVSNDVTIDASTGSGGQGKIIVSDAVSSTSGRSLTLKGSTVTINAPINLGSGSLIVNSRDFGTNNVGALTAASITIDATAGSGVGEGEIAIRAALTSANLNLTLTGTFTYITAPINLGAGSLIVKSRQFQTMVGAVLTAANITINGEQINFRANVNLGGGTLTVNAALGSVWQDRSTVITAGTVTGSSRNGFSLNGLNQITSLGAITNIGTAGITIKNNKALSIATTGLDGGDGGVTLVTVGFDLTLSNDLTIKGNFFRLDLGGTKNILSSGTIKTIFANNMDAYLTVAQTGHNATLNLGNGDFIFVKDKRDPAGDVSLSQSSTAPVVAADGISGSSLVITTSGSKAGFGVVYNGAVTLQNITKTSDVGKLRYIEGNGILVTGGNNFAGSLMLVSHGGVVISSLSGDPPAGVLFDGATVLTGSTGDTKSNLIVISDGNPTYGIYVMDSTVTAGGSINFNSQGISGNGFKTGNVSNPAATSVTAGVDVTISNSGYTGNQGLVFVNSIAAGRNLSLVQSGLIGDGSEGIQTSIRTPNSPGVTFKAGTGSTITIDSNRFINILNKPIIIEGKKIRLNLFGQFGSDVAEGNVISAPGVDVLYSGAARGGGIDIGATGSFTVVTAPGQPIQVTDPTKYTWVKQGTTPITRVGEAISTNEGITITKPFTPPPVVVEDPPVVVPPVVVKLPPVVVKLPPVVVVPTPVVVVPTPVVDSSNIPVIVPVISPDGGSYFSSLNNNALFAGTDNSLQKSGGKTDTLIQDENGSFVNTKTSAKSGSTSGKSKLVLLNLSAGMNVIIPKGDELEDTDNYLIPLVGNSSLWQ